MVAMILLVFFPFSYGILLSFTNSNVYNTDQPLGDIWIGVENFVDILTDFELVKTTDNYYVVKNTPKDPKSVEFAYYDFDSRARAVRISRVNSQHLEKSDSLAALEGAELGATTSIFPFDARSDTYLCATERGEIAQLARDRAEDTRSARVARSVDENSRVLVELDVAAVWPTVLLLRTHDDGVVNLALLHTTTRNRFFDAHLDHVAHAHHLVRIADEPVGHCRVSNPTDGNNRYLDFGFDALGQMAEDPFCHVIGGMVKVTGNSVTGRYMEGIGVRLCQKSGNLLCFL